MGESKLSRIPSFERGLRLGGFPVLMYHRVGDPATRGMSPREKKYWVPSDRFERQLRIIRELGFKVQPLYKTWKLAPGDGGLAKSVSLTFDDGGMSDYETAFPLLCARHDVADFFINPSNVGTAGHMNWTQIAEMARAGMSFHSHGMHHVDLSSLSIAQLRAELANSQIEIENRLGKPVRFLAVPYGLLNRELLRVALEEGYQAVCSSRTWPAWPGDREVPRAAVLKNTNEDEFRRLVAKQPFVYLARSARAALLHWPKRVLLKTCPRALTVRKLRVAA